MRSEKEPNDVHTLRGWGWVRGGDTTGTNTNGNERTHTFFNPSSP